MSDYILSVSIELQKVESQDKKIRSNIDKIEGYHHTSSQVISESISEAPHEVRINLNGHSSSEHWNHVTAQRDIFRIPSSRSVCIHKVRVLADFFKHPWWQRNAV